MAFTLNVLTTLMVFACGAVMGDTSKNATRVCDGLASYQLDLKTLWSKAAFPNQYPAYRPTAQWTRLIGRSHSGRYSLWSEGKTASANLKDFAEQGVSTGLDSEPQGGRSIFDTFTGPHITTGVGSSTVKFLVHSKYPKLSFVVRMIPSPDWFIGVDSVDLCTDAGQWKSTLTLDLHPMDAGTDRGFTFTSPNYRESKPIFTITSKHPDHPAGSFYYPDLDSLPPIARLQLTKIEFGWTEEETTKDTVHASLPDASLVHGSSGQYFRESKTSLSKPVPAVPAISAALKTSTPKPLEVNKDGAYVGRRTVRKSRISTYRQYGNGQTPVKSSKSHAGGDQPPVDCELSAWKDWTPCSKTCGFGRRMRIRTILRQPNENGQPCSILQEEQLCGGMSNCNWKYFSRSNGTLPAVSRG